MKPRGMNGAGLVPPGCQFHPGGVLAAGITVEVVIPDDAGKLAAIARFGSLTPPNAGDLISLSIPSKLEGAPPRRTAPILIHERHLEPDPATEGRSMVLRVFGDYLVTLDVVPTSTGWFRAFDTRSDSWTIVRVGRPTGEVVTDDVDETRAPEPGELVAFVAGRSVARDLATYSHWAPIGTTLLEGPIQAVCGSSASSSS